MRSRAWRRTLTLCLALAAVGLVVGVSGARVARENIGYVGVVRNGGPFDTRDIRQVLLPGQRLTWIGLFSQQPHNYPAANVSRTYTVVGEQRRSNPPGADVLQVPTKDGVLVGIDATVFVRFVGESNIPVLKRFDVSYGTRRFRSADGRWLYPWQGDAGFYAWMETVFRPVLEYDLRREVGAFNCAEIISSCALVTRGATGRSRPAGNANAIALRVSHALERDVTRTLGQPYFHNIRMRISRISLPAGVQSAIDDTQAKYAAVNGAEAEYRQAKFRAKANRLIGDSYNHSPALATVAALKAIPQRATVILAPGGKAPAILAPGGAGAPVPAGQ
jgi:regulator of protease activity HflC (stomatin/prohibitin superfamily)